jgi:hypothetical protein
MSKTKHRRFSAAFKTKVCIDALKERETVVVLAKKNGCSHKYSRLRSGTDHPHVDTFKASTSDLLIHKA